MILSDLHFGKTGHFRKSGIAVPQTIFKEDMQRLTAQVQYFKPAYLIIVGDLFHSHANKEMELFLKWRQDFENLSIQLVMGNHDILGNDWYSKANISCHEKQLQKGDFIFTHDNADCGDTENCYVFSGHIHPSVTLFGAARQSLKFPCFYFTKTYAVLPAFGRFTGMHSIAPAKKDAVYALIENKVMRVQG